WRRPCSRTTWARRTGSAPRRPPGRTAPPTGRPPSPATSTTATTPIGTRTPMPARSLPGKRVRVDEEGCMSASDGGGQATPTRKTRAMERRLAYLLSAFGLETVHRDVLRAALRVGRSKHGGRRTNLDARFKDTLRRFETQGWVSRDEKAVRVLA